MKTHFGSGFWYFLRNTNPGQPVSRILSGGNPAWMDIYLGEWSPTRSSGLPGDGWDTGRSRLLPDFSPA